MAQPIAPMPALLAPPRAVPFARVEPALVVYGCALSAGAMILLYAAFIGVAVQSLGGVKYLPVALGALAMALDLALDPLALRRLAIALRAFWPMAALAVWMVSAALVTRFHLGEQDTFLANGLCYLGFFVGYQIAAKLSTRPGLPWALTPLLLGGVAAFAIAPVSFALRRPLLHEAAYLFIPWMAYLMMRPLPLRRIVQALAVVALLAIGPLALKNTAVIVATMSLAGVYVAAHARAWGLARTFAFVRTWAIVAIVAGGLAAAWALAPRPEGFSTGNAEFRIFIYQARWQQFLDSPLVGHAWIGPPYIRFTLFQMSIGSAVANNAVTHNDHLDLLANGGLLAAALMLAFYVTLARHVGRRLRGDALPPDQFALVATLALCAIGGLITMAFNPVLGNATNGFMLWSVFGLLAGYTHFRNRYADG